MSQIDPFVGSVMQSPTVQRQQAMEKAQQARHAADLEKNAGLSGDRFEHAVESTEEVDPIHDEKKNDTGKKRQSHKHAHEEPDPDADETGLDLKA